MTAPREDSGYSVVHLITDLDVGGAELMLARLVRGLQGRGVRNLVVSMTAPGPVAARIESAGVRVVSLGLQRGAIAPGAIVRLRRLLAVERPDIVQTWMYHADLLGTLASLPRRAFGLVWNVRASNVHMRRYSRLSGLVRSACSRLSGIPDAVVANGVDIEEFAPDPEAGRSFRRELGIPEGALVIGLVARRDPMKGHEVFLEAAARLLEAVPSLYVVLAGEGVTERDEPFRSWIGNVGRERARRVRLLGRRDDVRRIYCALDVACSSSLFGEGFPNAVAEAMACGVPVVATDVGDTARVVGGNTQLLVRPRDASAILVRCLTLLKDASQRRQLGDAARCQVRRHFSMDEIVGQYHDFYIDLLQRRGRGDVIAAGQRCAT
jgi:glycosyltransferase involved in cell wall biosynthesis